MSAPDRSWTIAPTLLWFCGCLVLGLVVLDGGVQAIADRVTTRREPAPTGGPTFAAKPAVVAEETKDDKPVPIETTGDRANVGALADVCLDGTADKCKRWAMDGFYKAVAESKANKLGRPVRVSWYGDSVVATDAIPARLRARMQTELGDGGPGFLFAAAPHRFCAHESVDRSNDGEWRPHSISTVPAADQMYGVGGSSAETFGGGTALYKIKHGTATNVELYFIGQPKGGTVTVTADGTQVLEADTAADAKGGGHVAGTGAAAKKFELTTKGKVRLYGIDLENASGAVVDNFGIVSVHAKNFAARDVDDFQRELAHRSADLLLVMIGSNEAQWLSGKRALEDYQAIFEKGLTPLRKGRPEAACLVVSPLDQAESKDGEFPSRAVMPGLVETQRRAAHAVGCAFYSSYEWQGGKGAAAKWFKKGYVGSDFIHLSHKGASKFADGVFDTLMAGYARFK